MSMGIGGKVYIVGAGPGDRSLITLKALELLKLADVIIFDRLVNENLLKNCKPSAEIIFCGKEKSRHNLTQEQINKLLVKRAKEGKIVVRLKGGDPYLFGRGAEEVEECVKSNVPFEVVPGVSSAISVPAYAGIATTHRNFASTLCIVSGHEQPNKKQSSVQWDKLASLQATIVILMGASNFCEIVNNLIKNGKSPKTPVAIIQWGTFPKQKTIVSTLGEFKNKESCSSIVPPSVIVIGEVVELRKNLNWFEKLPLFGKRIIITSSQNKNSKFLDRLENYGAEIIEFPTVKIEVVKNFEKFDKIIATKNFNNIIFTSTYGVEFFFLRYFQLGYDIRELKDIKFWAIGKVTANLISQKGIKVEALPKKYDSRNLIKLFPETLRGETFLIPRTNIPNKFITDELKKRGAKVIDVPIYQTKLPPTTDKNALRVIKDGNADLIIFASSSSVRNFLKKTKNFSTEKFFKNVKVAVIGPQTKKTAEENNIKVSIMADEYSVDGLIEKILSYYVKKNGSRNTRK